MEQLGVFAKYWEPGSVKTRLAASIGEQAAADLYRLFLKSVLDRGRQEFSGRRVLAYSPPDQSSAFQALAGADWQLQAQAHGDLGARMSHYFQTAFASDYSKVVLLGSDSPNLPPGTIASAFRALDSATVVLGPSEDGGYYLIGMREFVPQVFCDIAWSTGRVYEQTTARLARDIRWQALTTWYDVDEAIDLQRLRSELANDDGRGSGVVQRICAAIDEALNRPDGGSEDRSNSSR